MKSLTITSSRSSFLQLWIQLSLWIDRNCAVLVPGCGFSSSELPFTALFADIATFRVLSIYYQNRPELVMGRHMYTGMGNNQNDANALSYFDWCLSSEKFGLRQQSEAIWTPQCSCSQSRDGASRNQVAGTD